MKKYRTQFHAIPAEIFELILCLRSEIGFSMAVSCCKPFALTLVSKNEEFNFSKFIEMERNSFLRIFLSCKESLTPADSEGHFFDNNPGCIIIDVGHHAQCELEESSISLMSNDTDVIALANKVLSKLKKISSTGAIAVNPDTGAEANIPSHRFTKGAKVLFDSGVRMIPVAGKSFLKF